jgi:hypothetical protein
MRAAHFRTVRPGRPRRHHRHLILITLDWKYVLWLLQYLIDSTSHRRNFRWVFRRIALVRLVDLVVLPETQK